MDSIVVDRFDLGWFKAVAKKRYAESRQAGLSSRESASEGIRWACERAVERSTAKSATGPEQSVLDRLLAQTRDGAQALVKRL